MSAVSIFELVLHGSAPNADRVVPFAVARLFALLPGGWSGMFCDDDDRVADGDAVVVVVPVGTPIDQVEATVRRALDDPALRRWTLIGCRPRP